MGILLTTGRIFFGITLAAMGLQAIFYRDVPYILPLPEHFAATGHVIAALLWGILFTLAGAGILLKKKVSQVSLLFGAILLLLFCFYYIPFEILMDPNYKSFPDWENAEKELAFAGGAFVIAGCFVEDNGDFLSRFANKLTRTGAIIFAVTIVGFGILHFMMAKEASPYVPAWIPWHLFWMYFCGAALIGSGIAIITKINIRLFASLLGLMIFLWFVMLHVPRVIAAPIAGIPGEISSAFFALAYSGIALTIADAENGINKSRENRSRERDGRHI